MSTFLSVGRPRNDFATPRAAGEVVKISDRTIGGHFENRADVGSPAFGGRAEEIAIGSLNKGGARSGAVGRGEGDQSHEASRREAEDGPELESAAGLGRAIQE